MNLNQLRFVRAVADLRSFSRAATACHIGQPSLSTAVAQLEEELGGRLFARTTRQVELTALGARLLPLIEGVLGAETELRTAARDWGTATTRLIRIGFSPAASLRAVHLALPAYRKTHPGVEVVFKECQQDDLAARLAAGTIDLALGIDDGAGTKGSVALSEEQLVVLPRGGGGKHNAPIPIRALAGETLIFTRGCGLAEAVHGQLRAARVSIREYPGQALSYRVVEEWAELGLGAGILPHSKVTHATDAARTLLGANGRPAILTTRATWARGRPTAAPERHLAEWLAARTPSLGRGEATPVRPARSPRG